MEASLEIRCSHRRCVSQTKGGRAVWAGNQVSLKRKAGRQLAFPPGCSVRIWGRKIRPEAFDLARFFFGLKKTNVLS